MSDIIENIKKGKNLNIHGFQFHPESISTKIGMKLIKNFIAN